MTDSKQAKDGGLEAVVVPWPEEGWGEWLRSFLASSGFFYGLVLVCVAVVAFGLGRMSVVEREVAARSESGVQLLQTDFETDGHDAAGRETAAAVSLPAAPITPNPTPQPVFASQNGTKYYYAHCGGLGRISDENIISYPNATAAESVGYALAANCGSQ